LPQQKILKKFNPFSCRACIADRLLYLTRIVAQNFSETGVTIRERRVEPISPPISTNANGDICGLGFNAKGIKPPIAVSDVSTTGKNLISPACSIALLNSTPFFALAGW